MAELNLLTDDQIIDFIVNGYLLIETAQPPEFHKRIDDTLNAMDTNPGDGILDAVPALNDVYNDPSVRGALVSLLGEDVQMHSHRHWHKIAPNTQSQGWHQDGTNQRHHQIRVVLAMYYPHEVTKRMGPTMIVPGTHFRNAPTDRMATYANIRGQVALTVKAGTVAITHYDLWHAGTVNTSDRSRHMLKFLFSRVSEPVKPSWNHDPDYMAGVLGRRFTGERPTPMSQSDHYKLISLRHEMYKHLAGPEVPKREVISFFSSKAGKKKAEVKTDY